MRPLRGAALGRGQLWYPVLRSRIHRLRQRGTRVTERDEGVLSARFAGRTLDEVGAELDLSRERVAQIEKKLLGRLSAFPGHDQIMDYLKYGDEPPYIFTPADLVARLDAELDAAHDVLDKANQRIASLEFRLELERQRFASLGFKPGFDLDYLEVSVRLYNVLKNLGVLNLAQVQRYTASHILAEKNCGRKTLAELRQVLAEAGMRLRGDES